MRITKIINIFMAAVFLFCSAGIYGEVQKITIKWTAALCQPSCIKGLEKEFKKIDGVAGVTIDQSAGQADIRWKPNVPFSYLPIKYAMSAIGLYVTELRMRVRGTIEHDRTNVMLVSIGDNSSYTLISPIIPNQSQSAQLWNTESYQMTPQMRERLIATETDHQVVTIDGPIFQAYRAPPLLLIVEQLNIAKPTPEQK